MSNRTASKTNLKQRESLSVVLEGNLQDMDASRVVNALTLLTRLVRSFSTPDEPIKMGVLQEGSSVMGVLTSPEISQGIMSGIDTLEKESTVPPDWNWTQIKHVRDLARLDDVAGIESVSIASSQASAAKRLTSQLVKSIDQMLKDLPLSLGSVTGELYAYQAGDRGLQAKIQPEGSGPYVKVNFTEELDSEIRDALRKNVNIYGLLKRCRESNSVLEVDAHCITVIPAAKPAINGLGIWEELKAEGVTVEDLMHSIRRDD